MHVWSQCSRKRRLLGLKHIFFINPDNEKNLRLSISPSFLFHTPRLDLPLQVQCRFMRRMENNSCRRAVTLTETLIIAALLAVVLMIIALGTEKVRSDLKHQQVWELLATLDEALSAYYRSTGHWPKCDDKTPGNESQQLEQGDMQTGIHECVISAMASVDKSQEILSRIPIKLRLVDNPEDRQRTHFRTVQDAWAKRLRCITARSASHIDRQAVAANNGKPIFISAGTDGRFGDQDVVYAADNLRSDELRMETSKQQNADSRPNHASK